MNVTEKQIAYIKDLINQAFAPHVQGPITPKTADWMKIREMVTRTAIARATDQKTASEIITALQTGLKSFGLYIGEAEWKRVVTTARETLCVLNMKLVVIDGQPTLTTVVVDKATAVIENPAPYGKATVL